MRHTFRFLIKRRLFNSFKLKIMKIFAADLRMNLFSASTTFFTYAALSNTFWKMFYE
jgi:hypothetical protein